MHAYRIIYGRYFSIIFFNHLVPDDVNQEIKPFFSFFPIFRIVQKKGVDTPRSTKDQEVPTKARISGIVGRLKIIWGYKGY